MDILNTFFKHPLLIELSLALIGAPCTVARGDQVANAGAA
jgi:hypothetical protein